MRRPSIPPFDTYREYFTKNWLEWFDSLDNDIKQTRLLLKSYIAHASLAHNDLTGIQGGTTGEYYHLSSADHTEAEAFLNGGTSTHTTVDGHITDATIHFTEASIDHTAIANIGTNSHAQIDTHIADDEIHNLDYDEREMTYTNGLLTQVVYKKATVIVDTMTITYDSSDRPLQYSYSSGKVVDLVHLGTGFLSEAV